MTVLVESDDRRYVLGVDGSSPADAAARWIMNRLDIDPAPVAVVTALPVTAVGTHPELEAGSAAELLARTRNSILQRWPQAKVTCHAITGPVPSVLTRFAKPTDLLVIGTHKTGFLHGRVSGTTAVQTVSLAHCQVLIVPDVELRFRAGVVAGIGSQPAAAQQVACEAGREAALRGSDVLLLHADHNPADGHSRQDGVLAVAADHVRKQSPRAVVISRATGRNPVDTLLDAARDKALLILGSSPYQDDSPWGSPVIHDVLLNLTAPVLITQEPPSTPASQPTSSAPTLVTA